MINNGLKIAVLGGLGMQGRAAVFDLSRCQEVSEIVCADAAIGDFETCFDASTRRRTRPEKIDAASVGDLTALLNDGVDVAIDLLPATFMGNVCQAALAAGVSVVNTNYNHPIAHLHQAALDAKIALMPECGLDPGIDLIIYQRAQQLLDRVEVINSYCGGLPEARACDNPLNYKISWIWEGVLRSTDREARLIVDGQIVDIPAQQQHAPENIHRIAFEPLGDLEAIPNGDAVFFCDQLGITADITATGRYSLRWPGWSAFWHPLKQLGFLDSQPVAGLPCEISPLQFVDKLLEPQLQYQENERDLVAMLNVFQGIRNGRRVRWSCRLLIERDLDTGLMAMAQGVGIPASIVAQMIATGAMEAKGVLSPVKDVPQALFFEKLKARGIMIEEEITDLT